MPPIDEMMSLVATSVLPVTTACTRPARRRRASAGLVGQVHIWQTGPWHPPIPVKRQGRVGSGPQFGRLDPRSARSRSLACAPPIRRTRAPLRRRGYNRTQAAARRGSALTRAFLLTSLAHLSSWDMPASVGSRCRPDAAAAKRAIRADSLPQGEQEGPCGRSRPRACRQAASQGPRSDAGADPHFVDTLRCRTRSPQEAEQQAMGSRASRTAS